MKVTWEYEDIKAGLRTASYDGQEYIVVIYADNLEVENTVNRVRGDKMKYTLTCEKPHAILDLKLSASEMAAFLTKRRYRPS